MPDHVPVEEAVEPANDLLQTARGIFHFPLLPVPKRGALSGTWIVCLTLVWVSAPLLYLKYETSLLLANPGVDEFISEQTARQLIGGVFVTWFCALPRGLVSLSLIVLWLLKPKTGPLGAYHVRVLLQLLAFLLYVFVIPLLILNIWGIPHWHLRDFDSSLSMAIYLGLAGD